MDSLTSGLTCGIFGKLTGMHQPMEDDEYLTKCVIDTLRRTVYIYSNEGDKKTIECDTVDEFMNVLQFVRATADEDIISYAEPA